MGKTTDYAVTDSVKLVKVMDAFVDMVREKGNKEQTTVAECFEGYILSHINLGFLVPDEKQVCHEVNSQG